MIHPVPKPVLTVKPRKPLRATRWGVSDKPRQPLPQVNVEATKKRTTRRGKQRNSPEEKEARRVAWERANGICEYGCGQPFDKTWGQYHEDYPEFHHASYDPPCGEYLRRGCHHRVELTQFSYRHTARKVA